jgi:hypothetical protein
LGEIGPGGTGSKSGRAAKVISFRRVYMRRSSSLLLGALALGSFSSFSHATTVLFDFGAQGNASYPANYNLFLAQAGVTDVSNASQITLSVPNLVDSSGNPTGISASFPNSQPTVTGPNHIFVPGRNTNGTGTGGGASLSGPAALIFDPLATQDNWYGGSKAGGSNTTYPNGTGVPMDFLDATLTISGLNLGTAYTFDFFGDRQVVGTGDNRITDYAATGRDILGNPLTITQSLNVSNNTTLYATDAGVFPDAGGNITIDVTPDALDNNSSSFYYLGAMRMTSPVPEPGTLSLLGIGALTLLRRRRV